MKDWKFLQVGNAKTNNATIDPSDAELRKLEDELNGWLKMYDSKDPNVDKGNIEKNIRAIRADIEKYKRKHKIVDNESIDKQEWSLFKGLKKDAEKEIGNSTWRMRHGTIAEVKDDGTVIYSKNGMTSKEKFETKEKAEEHLKFIGSTKVENSEKEIGNADLPTEQDLKNWIRMMEQDKREAQREMDRWKHHTEGQYSGDQFNTAMVKYNEAVSQIKKMQEELRQGKFKKVGNATGDEYNAEIQRLTKKAEQLRRMGQGRSAMEIEKQIEKLGKELREIGNKKTGNRSIRTDKKGDWVVVYINGWKAGAGKAEYKGETLGWQTDGHTYGMTPSGMKNATAFRKTYRSAPSDKQLAEDLIQDFWIHQNNKETMEKVGNKKLKFTDKKDSLTEYVYDEETQTGYIYYDGKLADTKKRVGPGWVDAIKQKAFESGVHNSKTGNRNFAIIQKTAWGSTKIAEWEANSPEEAVREFEQANPAYANGKKGKIVANAKPGSIASIGPAWMHGGTVYGKMDTDESGKHHNEYVKITWLGEGKGGVANYFIDDKMQSDKLGSLDKNELKRWAEQKVGNARHSKEQLLADVRELKKYIAQHPDAYKEKMLLGEALEELDKYYGVIVPNQEPKVDNLKRARNAMNKKCGNAQITLWKGNDTVLISEDGTVQYLESNSFEVDRAKYDSQQKAIEEMTKEGYRKK